MQTNVSIVIPNWNGEEKLKRHLPNVLKAARFSKIKEVIIVDDGSTDKSVEVIKKLFPEIRLIIKKKNSGFSSTVNVGVKAAKGDFVVLINNDASPEKNFISYLLPHFSDKKVFSVGCNVGGIWAMGNFKDGYFWHKEAEVKKGQKIETHLTLWASGGSGMFRKSMWDCMGGLDELFNPFYWEDVDLGYRAFKRGYINLWEPKSKVEHYKEPGVISLHFKKSTILATSGRNQLLFIWKNITDSDLIFEHYKALVKMLFLHPKYLRIFLAALQKLPKVLKEREVEKKAALLSDKQVIELIQKSN